MHDADSQHSKRIVLVTGPPRSSRNEYIQEALPRLREEVATGYYDVFEYMKRLAPSLDVADFSRERVFDISQEKLRQIRDAAFNQISNEIHNPESENQLEVVSTPTISKVTPGGDYLSDKVDCLEGQHMDLLEPTMSVAFIDDVLSMRERVKEDPLRKDMRLTVKDLALWRRSCIGVVQNWAKKRVPPRDWIIFARGHPVSTFVDLLLGNKPRVYVSYHITGQRGFKDIDRFIGKLNGSFVCIDPDSIRDWDIVMAYDRAPANRRAKSISIEVGYRTSSRTFRGIPREEIQDSIDEIRSQIVERDYLLIACTNATMIYHRKPTPSYGIMGELTHATSVVSKRVYVLYPFRTRPSPFFEQAIRKKENMLQDDAPLVNSEERKNLEDEMVTKLEKDLLSIGSNAMG